VCVLFSVFFRKINCATGNSKYLQIKIRMRGCEMEMKMENFGKSINIAMHQSFACGSMAFCLSAFSIQYYFPPKEK